MIEGCPAKDCPGDEGADVQCVRMRLGTCELHRWVKPPEEEGDDDGRRD